MAVYCKGTLGTTTLHDGADWAAILRLMAGVNLDVTARQTRALLRRRGVPDAEALLRLVLAYAVSGLSLRSTAAWASMAGVADLCDVSLMERISNSTKWLDLLWQTLLHQQMQSLGLPGLGMTVRLIDATGVSGPKSSGTDYRLHLDYRPQDACFAAALISDGHQSEGFRHFTPAPGDLFIGDRGYAKAKEIRHVLDGYGHVLIRIGWRSLVLLDPDGNPFDLLKTLAALPSDRVHPIPVQVASGAKQRKAFCSARLVLAPLPPEAAEKSRRKAKTKAKRQGRGIRPEGAIAARWVILLTTLPDDALAPEQVVALYRFRWQVELAFKRLKSILHLDRLPAKDPELARSWLAANFLAALLIDRLYPNLANALPADTADRTPLWRLYALTAVRLLHAILATNWHPAGHLRRLVEPPRKRKRQAISLIKLLS
jgi:hypothetical protein